MISEPELMSLSQEELQTIAAKAARYQRICVLGLGYVGLPTALLFTRHGFQVQGVDISQRVLSNIREGRVDQLYPELGVWWQSVKGQPNFTVDSTPAPADVFIITVPTPVDHDSKTCDLTAVKSAMASVVPVLQPGNIVILESTVPPGTTRNVLQPMIETTGLKVGQDIHLCFSPERILPGNTTEELVHNHRVLGGTTRESAYLAQAVFKKVILGEIYVTDDKTAEFCKLAENTYRDVNIALANELAILADEHGIDIIQARELINMHPRVNLLKPGIGVGGHCIAVDPWFFVEVSPEKTELIVTSRRVNDKMPYYCANKIMNELKGIENPRICAAGLTYKPDVADTRESPAMLMVDILREKGCEVVTFDPLLEEYAGKALVDAAKGTDYLAVLVPHTPILAELTVNRSQLESLMRTPNIRVF